MNVTMCVVATFLLTTGNLNFGKRTQKAESVLHAFTHSFIQRTIY